MKALTLYQPWATLVAKGKKKIETRSWKTNYRGPLAIHAAKRKADVCTLVHGPFYSVLGDSFTLVFGAVLATCRLTDCILITEEFAAGLSEQELAFGDFTPGRYAFELADMTEFKRPIPAKGKQRLWEFRVLPEYYASTGEPEFEHTTMRDFLCPKKGMLVAKTIRFIWQDVGMRITGTLKFERLGKPHAGRVPYIQYGESLNGMSLTLHLDLPGCKEPGKDQAEFYDGKLGIIVLERR